MAGERIPKIERLLNLTAMLLETRRPLTVEEIGAKMQGYPEDPDSFRRQFERDKDELRAAGVPLEVAPLDGTDLSEFGYRIPPERYYLPDPGFTEDETAAIWVAIHSIELDRDAGVEALRKFGIDAIDGPSEATPIANVSAPEEVATLRAAIAESRTATFVFNNEERTVEPHRLTYLNGRWYLTAYDRLRDDVRNFRVDRMSSDISLGDAQSFTPPSTIEGLSVEPWRFGPDEPTTVTVAVDADHVDVVRSRFGADAQWEIADDGTALVRCVVRGRDAFRTFMLSMLDHAVILGPPDVRTAFVASLEESIR